MTTEQILSTIILVLAVFGAARIIVDAVNYWLSCGYDDCVDTWVSCPCGIRYHLWVNPDKPAVHDCICGRMILATVDNDGRITTKIGKLTETQL